MVPAGSGMASFGSILSLMTHHTPSDPICWAGCVTFSVPACVAYHVRRTPGAILWHDGYGSPPNGVARVGRSTLRAVCFVRYTLCIGCLARSLCPRLKSDRIGREAVRSTYQPRQIPVRPRLVDRCLMSAVLSDPPLGDTRSQLIAPAIRMRGWTGDRLCAATWHSSQER